MADWAVDFGYLCIAFILSRVYLYLLRRKNFGDFVGANVLSFLSVFLLALGVSRNDLFGAAFLSALMRASLSQVIVLFFDVYKKAKI